MNHNFILKIFLSLFIIFIIIFLLYIRLKINSLVELSDNKKINILNNKSIENIYTKIAFQNQIYNITSEEVNIVNKNNIHLSNVKILSEGIIINAGIAEIINQGNKIILKDNPVIKINDNL